MPPINNQRPKNARSITTGKLELRKLWDVPKAEYIYALFVEVKVETCEWKDKEKTIPDWDKINTSTLDWNVPQGYIGNKEWAERTAKHFEIDLPTEEFKFDDNKESK